MKKTFLIALAGMMLFAFTQCGNKDPKAKVESLTKKVTELKDCKDFAKISKDVEEITKKSEEVVKAMKDDAEKKAYQDACVKLGEEILKKAAELKCDEVK